MHEIVDSTYFEKNKKALEEISQYLMGLHNDAFQCNGDFLIHLLAAGRAKPPHRDYLRRGGGVGAAHWAARVRVQPHVDAQHVERVHALRQDAQLLSLFVFAQAYSAHAVLTHYLVTFLILVGRNQMNGRVLDAAWCLEGLADKNT